MRNGLFTTIWSGRNPENEPNSSSRRRLCIMNKDTKTRKVQLYQLTAAIDKNRPEDGRVLLEKTLDLMSF